MKTTDFLGSQWEFSCMGCAVSDGSMPVPGGFIRRTQHFCVHQDPLIPLPGFLVIASLRHIHSIAEMSDREYQEFSELLRKASLAIKRATNVEFLTLVQEESSIHFHLWFFPWVKSVMEMYGKPSLTAIREIMAEVRKQPVNENRWQELQASIETIKFYWNGEEQHGI